MSKRNGLTKAEKLARFDEVQAERNRYSLAVFDMANHKFSFPVIEKLEDVHGRYKISMSYRAMPLFLVVFQCAGQTDQPTVLDEQQIRDAYRDGGAGHPYIAMLMRAVNRLLNKQYDKELMTLDAKERRTA
jgi:hypothetical protein